MDAACCRLLRSNRRRLLSFFDTGAGTRSTRFESCVDCVIVGVLVVRHIHAVVDVYDCTLVFDATTKCHLPGAILWILELSTIGLDADWCNR